MFHQDERALNALLDLLESIIDEFRRLGKAPEACYEAEIRLSVLRQARDKAFAAKAEQCQQLH